MSSCQLPVSLAENGVRVGRRRRKICSVAAVSLRAAMDLRVVSCGACGITLRACKRCVALERARYTLVRLVEAGPRTESLSRVGLGDTFF
jgi:hypothetical protein